MRFCRRGQNDVSSHQATAVGQSGRRSSRLVVAFWHRRDGGIAITSALIMPVVIGIVSLVAEFGHGLVTQTENQRIADIAAYAAGLAYSSNGTTAAMTSAAQNLAILNGLPASSVTASLVSSPRSATAQAVNVNVKTIGGLLLAPVLGYGKMLPVNAKSYAQMSPTASACMIALNATGPGISLTGGSTITAPSCTVASNASVAVPCGTKITAADRRLWRRGSHSRVQRNHSPDFKSLDPGPARHQHGRARRHGP